MRKISKWINLLQNCFVRCIFCNNFFRITESFKWAYALRTELGDPSDPEITEFIQQVTLQIIEFIQSRL